MIEEEWVPEDGLGIYPERYKQMMSRQYRSNSTLQQQDS